MVPVPTWKQAYDDDDAVIYLLDANLKIARCNCAWDHFALANHGGASVSSKVLGTCIMDVVSPELQDFYRAAYGNVQRFHRSWWHIFECSTPHLQRIYQMRIFPSDQQGLLIINTLISETPPEAPAPVESLDLYVGKDGIATMCSNCRRVRRLGEPVVWDWAPELLWSNATLTRFDLCHFCCAFHYHVS